MWGETMERFQIEDGEVRLWQEGIMTVIEAALPREGRGLLRLGAVSGDTVRSLGVLMPDGAELCLRRRLSRRERETLGLKEIQGFVLLGEQKEKTKAPEPEAEAKSAPALPKTTEAEAEKEKPPQKRRGGWFQILDDLDWRETAAPGGCFRDPQLAKAVQKVHGALLTREGEKDWLLAIPMDSDQPFPPLPVFRFGEPVLIRGESYVLFHLVDGELVD